MGPKGSNHQERRSKGKWGGGHDMFMTVGTSAFAALSAGFGMGTLRVGVKPKENYDFVTPIFATALGAGSLISGAAALLMGASVFL